MSSRKKQKNVAAISPVHTSHEDRLLQQAVIARIGNPLWDLLIVGDGSGSGWDGCAGWSSVLIADGPVQQRRVFYGACNSGSVNMAETLPYLQALTWYDTHYGAERLKQLGVLRVHILTDSQIVANWGNTARDFAATLPRKMMPLLSGLRELSRVGYHIRFHWAPRKTTELNWACDLIAGLARGVIKDRGDTGRLTAQQAAQALGELDFSTPSAQSGDVNITDPYSINPSE